MSTDGYSMNSASDKPVRYLTTSDLYNINNEVTTKGETRPPLIWSMQRGGPDFPSESASGRVVRENLSFYLIFQALQILYRPFACDLMSIGSTLT